jgi:hypothetical protein
MQNHGHHTTHTLHSGIYLLVGGRWQIRGQRRWDAAALCIDRVCVCVCVCMCVCVYSPPPPFLSLYLSHLLPPTHTITPPTPLSLFLYLSHLLRWVLRRVCLASLGPFLLLPERHRLEQPLVLFIMIYWCVCVCTCVCVCVCRSAGRLVPIQTTPPPSTPSTNPYNAPARPPSNASGREGPWHRGKGPPQRAPLGKKGRSGPGRNRPCLRVMFWGRLVGWFGFGGVMVEQGWVWRHDGVVYACVYVCVCVPKRSSSMRHPTRGIKDQPTKHTSLHPPTHPSIHPALHAPYSISAGPFWSLLKTRYAPSATGLSPLGLYAYVR